MKKIALLICLFSLNACTYNITQQQNGTRAKNQAVSISGSNEHAVEAAQGDGNQTVLIGGGRNASNDPPPSTYPEYNGYPGSGSHRPVYFFHNGEYIPNYPAW